jgi:glutamyl-tRNA synthetase
VRKNDLTYYAEYIENGDFKKTKLKINWLPDISDNICKRTLITYDHIITKKILDPTDNFQDYVNNQSIATINVLCEAAINKLHKGDIVQLERRGYFIIKDDNSLIEISSGKTTKMIN